MSLSKLFSLFALVSLSSVSVAACAANTDAPADENAAESADENLSAEKIHACKTDDDCVAVDKGGCCSNGWMEAVNKHHTRAYASSAKCNIDPRPMCPMYIVHDTRVAQCNANKCEMVAIDDIACGGHAVNPHACPSGYECEGKSLAVDGPGKCVEAKDCRSTGCDAGKYCSFCWGKYACIPNGAMC